jgi:hypothetical protein
MPPKRRTSARNAAALECGAAAEGTRLLDAFAGLPDLLPWIWHRISRGLLQGGRLRVDLDMLNFLNTFLADMCAPAALEEAVMLWTDTLNRMFAELRPPRILHALASGGTRNEANARYFAPLGTRQLDRRFELFSMLVLAAGEARRLRAGVRRMCCTFARIAETCRGLRDCLRHRVSFLRQSYHQLRAQTDAWAARPTACTQSRTKAFQRFQHVLHEAHRLRQQLHEQLCMVGLDRPTPARAVPALVHLEPLVANHAASEDDSWSSDDSGDEETD